ncbi:hypothetical protein ROHU_004064 [Labeo rohita]|uniref:Uncharacterized protein n=1 Tax=Labeo rohita TaxID=84645 RepID=A0A498NQM2_LABRO|nr:hypothetical protein ROHU_004064 [Labeo rohita]
MKPLPPPPKQRPSQPTQPPVYQVPTPEGFPARTQFASETEPMPQTSHSATASQPGVDAVSYTPHLSSYWLPTVEGPTFPDFIKEDRAQYVELRIALDNLLYPQLPEHYKYSILLKHVKVPNVHRLVLAHADEHTGKRRQDCVEEKKESEKRCTNTVREGTEHQIEMGESTKFKAGIS